MNDDASQPGRRPKNPGTLLDPMLRPGVPAERPRWYWRLFAVMLVALFASAIVMAVLLFNFVAP